MRIGLVRGVLESFIGLGIDMSAFSHWGRGEELRKLFDGYNGLMSGLDGRFAIDVNEGVLLAVDSEIV